MKKYSTIFETEEHIYNAREQLNYAMEDFSAARYASALDHINAAIAKLDPARKFLSDTLH